LPLAFSQFGFDIRVPSELGQDVHVGQVSLHIVSYILHCTLREHPLHQDAFDKSGFMMIAFSYGRASQSVT
jgi:hypothetical protein